MVSCEEELFLGVFEKECSDRSQRASTAWSKINTAESIWAFLPFSVCYAIRCEVPEAILGFIFLLLSFCWFSNLLFCCCCCWLDFSTGFLYSAFLSFESFYLSVCLSIYLSIYLFSTWNVGMSEMLEISHWNILTWLTISQAASFNYFSNKGCFNIPVEWPQRLLVRCPLCQRMGETIPLFVFLRQKEASKIKVSTASGNCLCSPQHV